MSTPAIESLYATGHWLLEQQRFTDAASVLRTMALAAPNDERSWLALGACHEGVGQHAVAVQLYRAGIELACPAVRCAVALSFALRSLDRDEEAEEALERAAALSADSGDPDARRIVAFGWRTS